MGPLAVPETTGVIGSSRTRYPAATPNNGVEVTDARAIRPTRAASERSTGPIWPLSPCQDAQQRPLNERGGRTARGGQWHESSSQISGPREKIDRGFWIRASIRGNFQMKSMACNNYPMFGRRQTNVFLRHRIRERAEGYLGERNEADDPVVNPATIKLDAART